jgi:hypothetical protein
VGVRLGLDATTIRRLQARGHLSRLALTEPEIRQRVYQTRLHLPKRLGVESLAHLRGADEVAEERGHDLPDLPRRRGRERRRARAAKARTGRVPLAALWTDGDVHDTAYAAISALTTGGRQHEVTSPAG